MLEWQSDFLRWLVLAEGAILFGFSFSVMVEARKFRMPPRHVWAIAISYMILVVGLGVEVHERLGDPTTWRTWTAFLAFSFGIYAQWLMYRAYHYAARLRRHEKKTVIEANRIMGEVFKRSSEGKDVPPPEGPVERRRS